MDGELRLWDLRTLKDVIIPEGIESIGKKWFADSNIENVQIPADVREVGDNAFQNCASLKRVTFAPGSRLERIGSGCFYNAAIESVTIPKGVMEIPKFAFCQCERLREVTFEEGSELLKIGESCFDGTAIERIVIPHSVEEIQNNAFCRCEKLAEVVFEKESSLKRIGTGAFKKCENLKYIEIPSGVEYIGASCFNESGLKEVALPGTPKEICWRAFDDCYSLRVIWVEEGCAPDV